MSQDRQAHLRCRCGAVRGLVAPASAKSANRVICYCDDCQAFAHWLGGDGLLDGHGGSDIIQVAPASLRFTHGEERIEAIRLSPRGLHRFYATCCRTPLGNMVSAGVPFVGLHETVFRAEGQEPTTLFGPPAGAIKAEFAVGAPPAGSKGAELRLIARVLMKVLGWRLTGRAWPHPFVERATGAFKFPVRILDAETREKLRGLCGPLGGKPI